MPSTVMDRIERPARLGRHETATDYGGRNPMPQRDSTAVGDA